MLGRFITIEGIDGAGKSTQTESLLKHLADQGVSVLHTREPGGTPLAEKIRAMLLADDMAPDAETLLFDIAPAVAAARLRARAGDQDRFERMGEAFFTRVREAYLARAAAAPERFLIKNADRPAKDVSADIFARISSWL